MRQMPPPPDTFTVVSALTSVGNSDQLNIVVDSPSTLTGLSVGFVSGGVDTYDQTLTQAGSPVQDPTDPTQNVSTWTANIPAGASGLALGSYSLTLNGTFADTTTYSLPTAETYNFFADSSLTLSAANTSLSSSDPSTTLSGQVTLTYLDNTADTDYPAGLEVAIESGGATIADVPVQSDGTFSYVITPTASETVDAEVLTDGEIDPSVNNPSVPLTVTTVTPILKLAANPVTETYGKPVTVSGTLTDTSCFDADRGPAGLGQHDQLPDRRAGHWDDHRHRRLQAHAAGTGGRRHPLRRIGRATDLPRVGAADAEGRSPDGDQQPQDHAEPVLGPERERLHRLPGRRQD